MKSLVCLVLASSSVLTSGCFSSIVWRGLDGKGPMKAPPPGQAVVAVAADIVTLPVQAPLLIIGTRNEADLEKRQQQEYRFEQIRRDPELIFTQKLHRQHGTVGWETVQLALQDPAVAFTDAQLRRLYQEMAPPAERVLGNPHCSPAFLREVVAKIKGGRTGETETLAALLANPKLPRDCLETIAADPKRFGRFSALAGQRLIPP